MDGLVHSVDNYPMGCLSRSMNGIEQEVSGGYVVVEASCIRYLDSEVVLRLN